MQLGIKDAQPPRKRECRRSLPLTQPSGAASVAFSGIERKSSVRVFAAGSGRAGMVRRGSVRLMAGDLKKLMVNANGSSPTAGPDTYQGQHAPGHASSMDAFAGDGGIASDPGVGR